MWIYFVVFLFLIIIIAYCIKNKVTIKFKSFFKKGFKLIDNHYGCYCATGKQGSR